MLQNVRLFENFTGVEDPMISKFLLENNVKQEPRISRVFSRPAQFLCNARTLGTYTLYDVSDPVLLLLWFLFPSSFIWL